MDKCVYSWFLLITDPLTCQIETFILTELKDNKDKWIFINYDTSKHIFNGNKTMDNNSSNRRIIISKWLEIWTTSWY